MAHVNFIGLVTSRARTERQVGIINILPFSFLCVPQFVHPTMHVQELMSHLKGGEGAYNTIDMALAKVLKCCDRVWQALL